MNLEEVINQAKSNKMNDSLEVPEKVSAELSKYSLEENLQNIIAAMATMGLRFTMELLVTEDPAEKIRLRSAMAILSGQCKLINAALKYSKKQ